MCAVAMRLSQWHARKGQCHSVKHLFVCLVWWMKQTWFTVMFLKGWTQIWGFFFSYLSVVISTLMWIFGDLLYTLSYYLALVSVMLSTVVCLSRASSYLPHLLVSTFLLMYWIHLSFPSVDFSVKVFFFFTPYPPFVTPSQSMAQCTSTCCLTQQSKTLWADAASLQRVKLANA